jgi:L-ribulose-5-phosphate 3-epimerase
MQRASCSRRQFIQQTAALTAAAVFFSDGLRAGTASRFRIGACDWSLNQQARLEAFDVARQLGLDGVQISYNSALDEAHLSKPEVRQAVKAAAKRTGVAVASLAIGRLNEVPYKSEPRTEEWVFNAVDAAKDLGVTTILLAFFAKNDLRGDATGKRAVIERLKKVAPHAEKRGITLAIESYLSAEEHLDIINAIGSKAVRVYYDFRNATDAGYDIYREIPLLGTRHIVEIHMKENGYLLGKGPLDWRRIRRELDKIGYRGWMQIEGAVPKGAELVPSYQQNLKYLRGVFA